MVSYYYPNDDEVKKDSELQEWIGEIFTHALLGNQNSGTLFINGYCRVSMCCLDNGWTIPLTGFPENFTTAEALINFLSVIIFTVSAQHSAVNNPQVWKPLKKEGEVAIFFKYHFHGALYCNFCDLLVWLLLHDAQLRAAAERASSHHQGRVNHGESFGDTSECFRVSQFCIHVNCSYRQLHWQGRFGDIASL